MGLASIEQINERERAYLLIFPHYLGIVGDGHQLTHEFRYNLFVLLQIRVERLQPQGFVGIRVRQCRIQYKRMYDSIRAQSSSVVK